METSGCLILMNPALNSALAMGAVETLGVNVMLGTAEMIAAPRQLAGLTVMSMEFVIIMNVYAIQDTMEHIVRVLLVVQTTALPQLTGNAKTPLSVFAIQGTPETTAH
jgi:hypothetical protein